VHRFATAASVAIWAGALLASVKAVDPRELKTVR
jgi:hypothetical protein